MFDEVKTLKAHAAFPFVNDGSAYEVLMLNGEGGAGLGW